MASKRFRNFSPPKFLDMNTQVNHYYDCHGATVLALIKTSSQCFAEWIADNSVFMLHAELHAQVASTILTCMLLLCNSQLHG